jgi:nitroimidazol reductase NimA-like FMN-containing flavoprotein (pyridoxamine 5'-phosphate oxidase superfamily)
MSDAELEEFLARGVVMRLACLDESDDPYVVPCWHEWRDGSFWVVPRERSRWAAYLRRDGRCAFTIDVAETLEKVIGKGVAEVVEEPNVGGAWVDVANRMAVRYLGEHGPEYLVPTLNQPRWLFRIRPTRMQTWQGVGWARSYGVEGTGGPSYEEAHGLA